MRFSALIPSIFLLAALVLALLCLFAGSSEGFLQDYPIITLNTSRIGQGVFNTSEASTASNSRNPATNFFKNITDTIEGRIQDHFTDFAKELGLRDWYAAHVLTFCAGTYLPNATAADVHTNTTACSNRTALYTFDPREILQRELNQSGHAYINLADLQWPDALDDGVRDLATAAKAGFVLYCVAIGFIGLALLAALAAVFLQGRLSALLNLVVDWLAFVTVGLASALVTAVGVKGADVMNRYGQRVGIVARWGGGFLGLTWASTACVFVAGLLWCGILVRGRTRRYKT